MPEPTRYSTVGDMEVDSLGGYIRYTDYAALRKLAEAVVESSRYPFNNSAVFNAAMRKLAEALQ